MGSCCSDRRVLSGLRHPVCVTGTTASRDTVAASLPVSVRRHPARGTGTPVLHDHVAASVPGFCRLEAVA
jgi:hypothetical protein